MGRRGRPPAERRITDDHVQILASIARGLTNPQIAVLMGRSTYWINDQLKLIFGLLEVQTRAQAVVVAIRRGLLPGGPAGKKTR